MSWFLIALMALVIVIMFGMAWDIYHAPAGSEIDESFRTQATENEIRKNP